VYSNLYVSFTAARGSGSLARFHRSARDAQLWAMVGITPMIGYNDDSAEILQPSDATAVTQFAEQNGVGLLPTGLAQRDATGTANDLDRFSQIRPAASAWT
jgi:hypothetical protein